MKGEHVARSVLRDLGCDLVIRGEIAHLVRYHGRPAFLLDRSEPTYEVVRLSWLVKNKLLHLFAVADSRGRDTDSMSRPEENLVYWKLLAEEADCYEQPYPFLSEHARFVFYREQKPNLYYVPHEAFACDVTMMSGLPGSGKDTWLARNCPGLPVVSLDDIRDELCVGPMENQGKVVQLARQRCRELLRAKTSFAFNATNLLRHIRKRWIDLFADYNAHIRLVYLEPPIDKLLRQNRNRPNSVPKEVVRKMAARCDPPTWAEGHRLFMIDGSSDGHGEANQASKWDAS